MRRTVIENGLILTMDPQRQVLVDGHVIVEDNKIVEVGSGKAKVAAGDEVVDARGCAVLPGFVNTHHHLAATLLRGVLPDRPLRVNASTTSPVMALHKEMDEKECHAGSLLAFIELIRSGVTTTTDSQSPWRGLHKNDGSLRAASEAGLRVIHSPAFVNRTEMVPSAHHYSVAEALAEMDSLRDRWSSDRIHVIPEVMSLPRGTDELITSLHRAGDGRMAMHLSYSEEFSRWAIDEYGHTAIEHLDKLGVLSEGFLGAHPIYFSDEEVKIYAAAGAAGAYCAVSNMLIGVGHMNLRRLEGAGVRMGLGLDYPNHGHNFFETVKMSLLAQKQDALDSSVGDPGVALEWATIKGAAALGLADEIGSLEVGKAADLQVIDLRRIHLWPNVGAISLLVYSGSPDSVRDVMADGRWLMRNSAIAHLDENEILDHAAAVQAAMLERADVPTTPSVPTGWNLVPTQG